MLAGEVMRARVRAVPLAGGQSGSVGFVAAAWPLLPTRAASALTAEQSSAAGSAACRFYAPGVADCKRFTCAEYLTRPHTTDLPMADIADALLAINARAYSFEAASAARTRVEVRRT